jgi:uncharacterized glyoxalase superfamily protein PhnB
MQKRKPIDPKSPALSPFLTVGDAAEALKFYEGAFGLTVRHVEKGGDGRTIFGVMSYGDSVIRLAPEGYNVLPSKAPASEGSSPTSILYTYCQDVDALFEQAKAGGAKLIQAPEDKPWGDRICILQDPDGYIWTFATKYSGGLPN